MYTVSTADPVKTVVYYLLWPALVMPSEFTAWAALAVTPLRHDIYQDVALSL